MLRCRSCQRGQPAAPHLTMLRHLLPLLGVRAISIFYQFIQFLEVVVDGEVERPPISISFFHFLADSAKHPAGQPHARLSPAYPARPLSTSTGSRGGRPVSAGTIEKQRPKMYLPVSFPSSTSKHSNRSRKNVAGPQFLLTMNFITTAPRPPPRKFDKSQNL